MVRWDLNSCRLVDTWRPLLAPLGKPNASHPVTFFGARASVEKPSDMEDIILLFY
jgi:hypothetical protein